jgi:hypothetical protein
MPSREDPTEALARLTDELAQGAQDLATLDFAAMAERYGVTEEDVRRCGPFATRRPLPSTVWIRS